MGFIGAADVGVYSGKNQTYPKMGFVHPHGDACAVTEKGFVYCDRSTRTNYYTAVITAEEYRASEGTSFIRKLYGGSVKRLVASLYDCQELDAKDIAELRAFLDELERKE